MKIESDTLVYIICIAAFIGYTLGIQHAITNVMKTPQQSNKVHKITQTNLSDLAEILASNHMIIRHSHDLNHEMCDDLNTQDAKLEDAKLEDAKLEDAKLEDAKLEDAKLEDAKTENVSEVIINNSGNTNNTNNNSEEEYEVITRNTKKFDTKNQSHYYFGWFDSMF